MKILNKILLATVAAVLLLTPTACFTGVESTPKITARDIKKRKITRLPEEDLLAGVAREKPSHWKTGKRFFVTDDRISLIFMPASYAGNTEMSLAGKEIVLENVSSVTSITGGQEMELTFRAPDGSTLVYRPGADKASFSSRERLDIPFTVECSVIDAVRDRMVGNSYYILTSRRLDANGTETRGLRYDPVRIVDVTAGNTIQPLRVYFDTPEGHRQSLMMTIGSDATSTRNFETLFAFTSPRSKYPDITDKVWEKIRHSQVETGMTPQACRLALGSPDSYRQVPSTMGMVEFWQYDNGVFLRFVNGALQDFRM